jgi:hypothetical protein
MKICLIFVFCVLFSANLAAQKPMFNQPLSPRIANYEISVTLDPLSRQLSGKELLTWRNDSPDYIDHLQFHLYLNAFKNELTTFMKESGGSNRGLNYDNVDGWGWIEISGMVLNGYSDLKPNFSFIQPDDANRHDQTVLRVDLNTPLKPGETINLDIDFIARLPEVLARTGYKGDFYMVGQWFPKIGVYESAGERYALKGQWNCHQFHLNTEFFADYGNYEVTITLPEEYIVGATGVVLKEIQNQDSTKSLTYYCEDIHDFAWTADPDYIVIEDEWRHVKIKFLAHPGRESQSDRHIQAAKNALEFFDDWYGHYPYPILTIVDPRYKAFGAGGMEYPTLITAGSFWLLPDGLRLPEVTTVHEFGHNYWYGIVGSNEFEEAWLDEGINTYAEIKVMEKYYGLQGGSAISFLGLNIGDDALQWSGYVSVAKWDAIFKNAWEYKRGGYGSFSYNKPAMMLLTLHNYVGESKMKEIMRTYFGRFKFKHPTSGDFIATFNEVSGQDFNWFFDQVLYGTDVLDYKIDRISSRKIPTTYEGIFTDPLKIPEENSLAGSEEAAEEEDISDSVKTSYESKIIVAREGEVIFPVEILVKFEEGGEILENWDGKQRYLVLKYETEHPVVSAEVDPQKKVWLDVNFLNNGKTVDTRRSASLKYSTRWFFWMQNFLHLITIFN